MKVTQIILTKLCLITPPETWVWEEMQRSDSKFEFAGGVANWYILDYELSVVNNTTDVDWLLTWQTTYKTVNIEHWV